MVGLQCWRVLVGSAGAGGWSVAMTVGRAVAERRERPVRDGRRGRLGGSLRPPPAKDRAPTGSGRSRTARPAGRAAGSGPGGTATRPGHDERGGRQQVVGRGQDAGPGRRGPRRPSPLRSSSARWADVMPDGAVAGDRRRGAPSNAAKTSACGRPRPASRAGRRGRRAGRGAAATRSPRPSTRAGPPAQEERHVRAEPSARARRVARRRARRPTPRWRRSRAAAPSDDPPPRPAADRDALLEPGRQRRGRSGTAGPAAADDPPGRRDARAGRGCPAGSARDRARRRAGCPPRAGGRRQAEPVGERERHEHRVEVVVAVGRRPTTARVRLSLAGARRTTGVRRRRIRARGVAGHRVAARAGRAGPGRAARAPRAGPATPPPRASAAAGRGRCRPRPGRRSTRPAVDRQLAGEHVVEHLAALAERRLDQAPELVLRRRDRAGRPASYGSTTMTAESTAGSGSNAVGGTRNAIADAGVVLDEDREVAHLPGRRRDPLGDLALDHEHEPVRPRRRARAARAGSGW